MTAIYQLPTQVPGMVGVLPNPKFMVTGDNLATVTTAGYLNQVSLESNPVAATDVIQCLYSFNLATQTGTYGVLSVSISNGVITLALEGSAGEVTLPTIANHIATFTNVSGGISEDPATAISGGNIQAGLSGTAGYLASFPATGAKGSLRLTAVDNTGNTLTTISNAAMGQASVVSIPDPGVATTSFILADSAGTQTIATGNLALTVGNLTTTAGNVQAGSSGHAGTVTSFPTTAANGSLILQAVNAGGAFNTTIASGTIGQSSVITIPDPGAATANFMLDAGTTTAKTITTLTSTTANITNLKYGATPVAQVDPASCTITAAAGASNTATVTIQLKDGSGTNMTRIIPFRVYASSTADGLTLQSAASTGFSVASGGLSLNNGAAITTQISCMSSATGGCVLSLLDTGKQTSYLVLVLANGCKISAQLSAGSYGA